MLDWNLKSTWDGAYFSWLGPFKIAGYWRYFERDSGNGAARKVAALSSRLGITDSTSIAVVGGGFGYLQEDFKARMPSMRIATTDTSTWVQSSKNQTELLDLESMLNGIGLNPRNGDGSRIFNLMNTGLTRSQVNILDNDISTNRLRNDVRLEAGLRNNEDFDLVISDDVLPTLTDAEAINLSSNMAELGNLVVHIVTPGDSDGQDKSGGSREDLDYNWHTLSEWKSILPNDGIISVTTFESE